MAERDAVWVYAVAGADVPCGINGPRGVGNGPVRTVTAAGLTAVTEEVPLAGFGEAALRRNLEDLDWLESAARAHHRVISAVARHGAVVPMRLATVYRGEQGVRAALAERAADFRAVLDRIGTRQEWGVKAYAVPPPENAAPPRAAPARPGEPAQPGEAGAGAAYLSRRREQISGQQQARRAASAAAQAVHASLSRLAGQARLHPPQTSHLSARKEQMVLNAAYLLDEQEGPRLGALVSAFGEQYPQLHLELTGPWPPYSFAGLEEGLEHPRSLEEGLEDPRSLEEGLEDRR